MVTRNTLQYRHLLSLQYFNEIMKNIIFLLSVFGYRRLEMITDYTQKKSIPIVNDVVIKYQPRFTNY